MSSLRLAYADESVRKHILPASHHDAKLSYTRKTHSTNLQNDLYHCGTLLCKSHFVPWGQKPYTTVFENYVFVTITSPRTYSYLKKAVPISSSVDFALSAVEAEHWEQLPRQAVESPPPEIFQNRSDKHLPKLLPRSEPAQEWEQGLGHLPKSLPSLLSIIPNIKDRPF